MSVWVFGYGSLIWNPGFEYLDSKVGYIKGFNRRFWQGNDFHRGSPTKLGRVATLVEEDKGLTWGKAFLLGPGAESSLSYLDSRETKLGGYCTSVVPFYSKNETEETFPVLLYMALPSNHLYMGPAPLPQVAAEIAEAAGHCGHNAEYLFRLANFMKEYVPESWDEHLYNLEYLVRIKLKEMNLSEEDIMRQDCLKSIAGIAGGSLESKEPEQARKNNTPSSMDYVSQMPSRKLRCADI